MLVAVDPGYRNIGYCVGSKTQLNIVSSGTIITTAKTFPDQLLQLGVYLNRLLIDNTIDTFVYEKPTYSVGHNTGTKVQQAIGVMLYLCALNKIHNIIEYTPSHIKKELTTSGKADKFDIQKAILNYLPNEVFQTNHQSDSIAMYICWLKKNASCIHKY